MPPPPAPAPAAGETPPSAPPEPAERTGPRFDIGKTIGTAFAAIALLIYFAWLGKEMGAPVVGGHTILIVTFGGIAAAAIVGALPLAVRSLTRRPARRERSRQPPSA